MKFLQEAKRLFKLYTDRDHLWMTRPVTIAAVLVLLVLVKSCQGIVYIHSNENKIHQLGYPIDEARALAQTLSDEQAKKLIDRQEHDTLAYPLTLQRYFIVENFDRYLAYHKTDTAATPSEVVALVNVWADEDWKSVSAPSDTSKGYLILVNRHHFIDKDYKRDDLVEFKITSAYKNNRAARVVVEAFEEMQKDCKKQTKAQLMVNSSYRSYGKQKRVHKHMDENLVAVAGYSEHQTGLCLDITSLEHPEKWSFGKSKEGKWMRKNCHEYGFIVRYPKGKEKITGYSYEPWHLRYVGIEAATHIHDEGITLDEYYAYYIDRVNK